MWLLICLKENEMRQWCLIYFDIWVLLDRQKKSIKMLPDGHLTFECSVLYSNVEFYFKIDEYSKFIFFFDSLKIE